MGAVLRHEQCDPRLAAIEEAAYRDMHGGLVPAVHRSMRLVANRQLREAQALVRKQHEQIAALQKRVRQDEARHWVRRCWMCGAPEWCEHRELELASVWRK
jgi:hypothetical protein